MDKEIREDLDKLKRDVIESSRLFNIDIRRLEKDITKIKKMLNGLAEYLNITYKDKTIHIEKYEKKN